MQPSVVTAAVNFKNAAHAAQAKLGSVRLHERVLHPDCLAKYAVETLQMPAHSFLTTLFSVEIEQGRSGHSALKILVSVLRRRPGHHKYIFGSPVNSQKPQVPKICMQYAYEY